MNILGLTINARLNGQASVVTNYARPLSTDIDTNDLKESIADGVSLVMDEMRKRGFDVREYFICISYEPTKETEWHETCDLPAYNPNARRKP